MKPLFFSLILAVSAAGQPRLVVTDLGTLGGSSSNAVAINNLGQVTGSSVATSGQSHVYRTAPNRGIQPGDDLGTLGGTNSVGNAINDSGQVGGTSSTGSTTHAFRSSANGIAPATLTDLGTFDGTLSSFGRGINNSGQVTGEAHVANTLACFNIFSNSVFRTSSTSTVSGGDNLGTLLVNNCRSAQGIGINDSGTVVGDSATVLLSGVPNHAFRSTGLTLVDIHPSGYQTSQGYAVNSAGQVTGTAVTFASDNQCFRTAPGQSIVMPQDNLGDLGGGYCQAFGINDQGDVVGTSSNGTAIHAFLYSNAVMYDLNNLIGATPGVALTIANSINENGQIAVGGFAGSDFHGFRLDPADVYITIFIGVLSDPDLALTPAQLASYTDKLNNALSSIQQSLYKQAINQLNALINAVQAAQKTGKLSTGAATKLINSTNAVIAAIS